MGKKKKKESPIDRYLGRTSLDKLAKETGFRGTYFSGKPSANGGVDDFNSRKEWEKAARDHVNNNYHIQSAIDHGRDSGNKRAKKLSKELKSDEDFMRAEKYMRAGHKHGGNGGSFSSMGDYIASQDYRFDKNMSRYATGDGDGGGNNNSSNNNNSESETPQGKSDEHLAAEEEYLSNFTDGNPWAAADPVEAYKRSFNDAKAIGQEWDSGYYMRRLSQDKLEGVNRFTDYLGDMNKLVAHEQNYAALKAINRIDEMGAEPPSFTDPFDLFERYRDELKEDFD